MYLFPAVTEDLYHNYTHGVYYDVTNNTDIDHDISVVGYGYDEETGWDYWLVRNSWGTYWVSTKKISLFSTSLHSVSKNQPKSRENLNTLKASQLANIVKKK